jgi:hypothetical protein
MTVWNELRNSDCAIGSLFPNIRTFRDEGVQKEGPSTFQVGKSRGA